MQLKYTGTTLPELPDIARQANAECPRQHKITTFSGGIDRSIDQSWRICSMNMSHPIGALIMITHLYSDCFSVRETLALASLHSTHRIYPEYSTQTTTVLPIKGKRPKYKIKRKEVRSNAT